MPGRARGPPNREGPTPLPEGRTLRRVRLSDAPTLVRHRSGMLRDIGGHPEARLRRHERVFGPWVRRELRARRLWGYLVEGADGTPLASGIVWLQPRNPSARDGATVTPYIFSVFTEPSVRRRGLATAIVRTLLDSAKAAGHSRVELHATEAGRPIYERLGFRPTRHMRWEPGDERRRRRRRGR